MRVVGGRRRVCRMLPSMGYVYIWTDTHKHRSPPIVISGSQSDRLRECASVPHVGSSISLRPLSLSPILSLSPSLSRSLSLFACVRVWALEHALGGLTHPSTCLHVHVWPAGDRVSRRCLGEGRRGHTHIHTQTHRRCVEVCGAASQACHAGTLNCKSRGTAWHGRHAIPVKHRPQTVHIQINPHAPNVTSNLNHTLI